MEFDFLGIVLLLIGFLLGQWGTRVFHLTGSPTG